MREAVAKGLAIKKLLRRFTMISISLDDFMQRHKNFSALNHFKLPEFVFLSLAIPKKKLIAIAPEQSVPYSHLKA